MNRNTTIALIVGGALASPYIAAALSDAVLPVPPLPDPEAHASGWNEAWASMYNARPLATERKRAVNLAELAAEQVQQVGTITHEQELAWLNAWHDAWEAGHDEDPNLFGIRKGGGEQYGGIDAGGLGSPLENAAIEGIDSGDYDEWGADLLSPLGLVYKRFMKHRAKVFGLFGPWPTGDESEVTIGETRAVVVAFAGAMDVAHDRAGFLGQAGHLATSALSWAAGGIGDAIGDVLGGTLAGIGRGLLPLALVGGGAYVIWRHYR